jgi:hypothetical protein
MTWGWEKRTHSHEHHVADGQLRRVAVRCGMHQLLDDLARREIPQLAHLLCGHLNFVARTEVGMGGGGGEMPPAPTRTRGRPAPRQDARTKPVAQKEHPILQPTCDDTQSVVRLGGGDCPAAACCCCCCCFDGARVEASYVITCARLIIISIHPTPRARVAPGYGS